MHKKKILLTGASESIGTQILKELLKRLDQYQLKIFARKSKKNKKPFRSTYQVNVGGTEKILHAAKILNTELKII
ncbi:MAG: hypothetical protein GF311_21600 [Candidatus Lokiarchaeota archaeon]|nr:hypothetical protein [Candidatus Lokiarchaeota archaeon]